MLIFGVIVGENKMNNLKVLERYDVKYLESAWDNKILNYDKNKFDWPTIFLETIQEKFPSVDKLDELHLHVATNQLVSLRQYLEKMTNGSEFRNKVDEFFEINVSPLLPSQDYMIQKTPGIRLLVPDQEKKGRLLAWHTGHHTGYDNGMYTVWTPVTRTWDTNAMQVMSWDDTITAMTRIHSESMPLAEVQDLCKSLCWPTNLEVGQSWLFNQGHLHGNFNNDTGVTRISFDIRAMTKGTNYGFRYPGGFWRLRNQQNDFEIPDTLDNTKKWIVFSDQGSDYIDATPQFIIREFLLSWCKRYNITPIEWNNEYLHCDWNINLQFILNSRVAEAIAFPSIYAFTAEPKLRLEIMQLALDKGIQLVFVDENILLDSQASLDYIKKIYAFAYTGEKNE
jgi:hypothetical protein